jgi:hypothetical protein
MTFCGSAVATLDAESEGFVLKHAGFNRVGDGPGQLHIIRTTLDRPELEIVVHPLRQKRPNARGRAVHEQKSSDLTGRLRHQ